MEKIKRPTWDESFMRMAKEVSQHSTCCKIQVGCVIVRDKRVISIGYNGTPSGHEHCEDYFRKMAHPDDLAKTPDLNEVRVLMDHPNFKEYHRIYQKSNELHAEQNAIAFAAKRGIPTEDCSLYVTHSPCNDCSKLIIAAGISTVYFDIKYDGEEQGLELMKKSNIVIRRQVI